MHVRHASHPRASLSRHSDNNAIHCILHSCNRTIHLHPGNRTTHLHSGNPGWQLRGANKLLVGKWHVIGPFQWHGPTLCSLHPWETTGFYAYATRMQVLFNHFSEHQTSDDHLDKGTFFKSLGAGEIIPKAVAYQLLASLKCALELALPAHCYLMRSVLPEAD